MPSHSSEKVSSLTKELCNNKVNCTIPPSYNDEEIFEDRNNCAIGEGIYQAIRFNFRRVIYQCLGKCISHSVYLLGRYI